jgi:hypothetical protein
MPAIRAIDQKPDERIAETLERLAEKARAGEVVGFVALVNYRQTTGQSSAGHWENRDALMAFELWKKRMLEGYEYQDD